MLAKELRVSMVMTDQLLGHEDGDWYRDGEVYVGYSRLRLRVPVPAMKKASVEDKTYVNI